MSCLTYTHNDLTADCQEKKNTHRFSSCHTILIVCVCMWKIPIYALYMKYSVIMHKIYTVYTIFTSYTHFIFHICAKSLQYKHIYPLVANVTIYPHLILQCVQYNRNPTVLFLLIYPLEADECNFLLLHLWLDFCYISTPPPPFPIQFCLD